MFSYDLVCDLFLSFSLLLIERSSTPETTTASTATTVTMLYRRT